MMFRTAGLLASIPSPSSGTLTIGPLKIHAYGLMIALGIVAGVWLMGRRFEKRGIGTRDDANSIAVWAVIAGVIGARLYHVATDWSKFENHLSNIPKLWQGGLGIPGGLLAGIGVGIWMIRRKGMPVAVALDCAAPALPLAQAIGRVQLLQPGTVRPSDNAAVGAADRRRQDPARLRPWHDVPSDVPVRVAVEPRALWSPHPHR